jgi:muconolactone D-isomerase
VVGLGRRRSFANARDSKKRTAKSGAATGDEEVKYLVRIQVNLPPSVPAAQQDELQKAELERGRELVGSGAIAAIWRIPGAPLRNVGIWEAKDATELHDLIASLPLFPWIEADVTPLAEHPLNR